MLDNLLDIEVAYSLLRGGNEDGDKDPIDINYEKLRTDIKVKKKKKWLTRNACWCLFGVLTDHLSSKWTGVLAWVQRRATKMAMVLEHMLHKVMLRDLGLFNVKERGVWVHPTGVYKFQVGWRNREHHNRLVLFWWYTLAEWKAMEQIEMIESFFFFPPICESCLERLCWFYLCKVWLDSDYSNLLQLILLWTGWLKVVQVSRGAFLLPPAAVLWSSAFCRLYQFTGWG